MLKSQELFKRAQELIPGGVNSPIRNFQSVNSTPRFIESAKGARMYDVEGNGYIDYIGSWGPLILGHAHPEVVKAVQEAAAKGLSFGASTKAEIKMAELICEMIPSIEMVRMVNSGTEAVMSAIRVARGYTGKNKVIKFEGCYHGHSDAMLVKAGSGAMLTGVPSSLGVPEACAQDTLTATYNDLESVAALFEQNKNQVAAVIIELVAGNMGVVLPETSFLKGVQQLCQENNALLIADEVITGFRVSNGGAQKYYGIEPDLTTLGKIIGGGMPVGAYGGKKEIMQQVSPLGAVYQAGTLSGNPVAMAAGIAQLNFLKNNSQVYEYIAKLSHTLCEGLRDIIKRHDVKAVVNGIGSLSCLYFTDHKVTNYAEAKMSDTEKYSKYFNFMLSKGIYLAPAQFEATFVSYAHTEEDIAYTLDCAETALKTIK